MLWFAGEVSLRLLWVSCGIRAGPTSCPFLIPVSFPLPASWVQIWCNQPAFSFCHSASPACCQAFPSLGLLNSELPSVAFVREVGSSLRKWLTQCGFPFDTFSPWDLEQIPQTEPQFSHPWTDKDCPRFPGSCANPMETRWKIFFLTDHTTRPRIRF